MIKYLLSILLIVLMMSNSSAQRTFWNSIDEKDLKVNQDDIIEYDMILKQANYFSFNKTGLLSHLSTAPYREETSNSDIEVSLPNQDGSFEIYEMFKVKTLAPELAQNYPEIQSFVGRRANKRDASVLRLTITPQGIYAMIKKPDVGQVFINPYDKNGDYYVSFLKSDAQDITTLACDVNSPDGLVAEFDGDSESDYTYQTFTVDDNTLRTYDLALAGTGEYSQYHINQAGLGSGTATQQVAAVLAAMVVTVDRVNSIYENDMGVTFQIIASNDQIIYLDPGSDPYTGNNAGAMISENQVNITNVIGSNNYDIGHVFSTGGAGLASLNSICSSNGKARGVTGIANPIGDPFDIDYVSHEFGHQLGATHTQNNDCQRSNQSAFETGSGSTIMGYAGICPPNVQNNSDANFHQVSINQMFNNITSGVGASCGNFGSQSNTAPTITALPPSYTIPNGTAFYLDVNAVDAENDPITFNWEQVDNEISTQPPLASSTNGPNFRALPSSSDSRRYFPRLESVIANNLTPTWEVVPSVARSMDFVVTVRDNNIQVGQSSRDFTTVNFANVGPFQVTSQDTNNINWLPGETRTVTWDVAGTTANGINTSNVNILLSTDGGITFDTTLASSTPNDGSHDITVPNVQAAFCRIMVEAEDNIFFALNPNSFAIDTNVSTTCDQYANSTAFAIPDGNGTPTSPSAGSPVFSTIAIPDDIQNITDINIHINATHDSVDEILFQLQNSGSDFSNLWIGNCSGQANIDLTFNDNGSSLPNPGSTSCGDPITGTYSPVDTDTSIADIFAPGTQGTFALAAVDFVSGNTGSINSWEIEICSTTFSTEDNQINNFSITPNPNNGLFNLNFTQPVDSTSEISLYNIQGRLIEKLDFNPNLLTQQIQLKNQYQSGVYLIEISNNDGKFVQKLVIK